jgi:tellurite resistance protein TerC
MDNPAVWVPVFIVFVAAMLALDLGVFHRRSHTVRFREAVGWSVFWITLALSFNAGVYFLWPDGGRSGLSPGQAALTFLNCYLIELALSVDNIFVFIVILGFFRVPKELHHKVLFWGIVGVLVMRGVFILAGVALIERFHFTIYIFGAILLYSGFKMLRGGDVDVEPEHNWVLRAFRRRFAVTKDYVGSRFFARVDGRLMATPLFVVLLAVESTDLVFAVDSIPAVIGFTSDLFIVYTSNVFAILGLRSLYFVLAGSMQMFRFLPYGLAVILMFVGVKMLLDAAHKDHLPIGVDIPIHFSLAVVGGVLLISILASLLIPARTEAAPPSAGQARSEP